MCVLFTLYEWMLLLFFFFFQAEDGIRDYKVTGVQTCALPIYALAAELGGAQLALDAVAQIDDRAAGVDLLHHTLDDRALGVVGDIGGERILRQLFDAE